jgi:predicted PurR-regulated permease PerM
MSNLREKQTMETDNELTLKLKSKAFTDAMIRFSVIAVLAILCVRVFSPFLNILLWGLILAIMLYPLHQRLAKRLKDRQGRTATLMVVTGCLLLGVPLGLLGNSIVTEIHDVRTAYESNSLTIPEPDTKVAEWPIIGEKLYKVWNEAATNIPKFLKNYEEQIKKIGARFVSAAGNAFGSVFLFLGALIIAGIMMAWGKPGGNAMQRILNRVAGPVKGPQLQKLSVATVRSVATGVLGVALIQALLFGIGFILASVPAAGLLALIVMFICIIQLPAIIVAVPAIIYIWSAGDASTTANIFYSIYFVFAGISDNVLKPMLLGRGVDVPMPIILIGAIGGMIATGFIGLFLGAVLLAIGYQIFMVWIDDPENNTADESAQDASADSVASVSE